jgi:arylsulfatase A-like enzyme
MRRGRLLLPLAAAAALWSLGTALVLVHVLRDSDFVMAEIRRHRLVWPLMVTHLAFLAPYLAHGAAAAWVACGLVRLRRGEGSRSGWLEGAVGTALLGLCLAGWTAVGMLERPCLFDGLFYLKGGARRQLQLALEGALTPPQAAGLGIGLAACLLLAAGLGWWRTSRGRAGRAVLAVGALATLAVPLSLRSRGPHSSVTPRGGPPNIVVVLVDSLRSVPFAPPPGHKTATPEIDRLAREGVRFTRATTPGPRTYPSLTSLLTGLHPLRHGIRTLYPDRSMRGLRGFTLPRALRSAGYTTLAVGGYCATTLREIPFGFDVQRTPRSEAELILSAAALRGHPLMPVWARWPWARALWPQVRTAVEGSRPRDVTGEAVAAWRGADGPFFLVVFYDNPHLPYVPTWPASAATGGYAGVNRYHVVSGDFESQVRAGEGAPELRARADERDNVRRLYAAAVHSVDAEIGALVRALDADGLGPRTLLAVLGDHGENLLDAGGPLGHGEAMERDRSHQIPLVVRGPGLRPAALDDEVSIMDLAPTLVEMAGGSVPPGLDGRSLAPRLRGGEPLPGRAMLYETELWFTARETSDRLDPGGRGLAYPDFTDGLLRVEPGDPPHIVIASEHLDAVYRAKHRRIEVGPWALTYKPRGDGPVFALYRRDLDPWLTRDLSASEPAAREALIARFYAESVRLGDRHLLPRHVPPATQPPQAPASSRSTSRGG